MPRIEDYAALAPFTLDELVDAANAVLGGRPTLRIQARTVRFYISKGLLPPPSGAPKFARYSMEHLQRLVEIRQGQDQGLRLDEVAPDAGRREATFHAAPRPRAAPAPLVPAEALTRYRLTPFVTLEVGATDDPASEIRRAMRAMEELLRSLHDTT